jgi:GTPase SAR1 family protein
LLDPRPTLTGLSLSCHLFRPRPLLVLRSALFCGNCLASLTMVGYLDFGPPIPSAMREHYMLDGEGFLLVYSITERDSFKMIESYHQQILRVKDTQAVPIIVVGNKSDLECERRVDMVGASHLNFHSTPRPPNRTFDWRHVGPRGGNCANIHFAVDIKICFSFWSQRTTRRGPIHRREARMSIRRDVSQIGKQRNGDVHRSRM